MSGMWGYVKLLGVSNVRSNITWYKDLHTRLILTMKNFLVFRWRTSHCVSSLIINISISLEQNQHRLYLFVLIATSVAIWKMKFCNMNWYKPLHQTPFSKTFLCSGFNVGLTLIYTMTHYFNILLLLLQILSIL